MDIDDRNWPALGDNLVAHLVAGCAFLTLGKNYQAVSDVVDNHIAIVDDSGDVNEYLTSHFLGFKHKPLPKPLGGAEWRKVELFTLTDYSNEAILSELHHMARRLQAVITTVSIKTIHDHTKPNESH